jgi:hypothetical protein
MKKQYTLRKDGVAIGTFSSQSAAIEASGKSIFTKPTPDGCSKAWNIGDVWTALSDAQITITVSRAIGAATKNELAIAAHRINSDSDVRKQLLALINTPKAGA